MVVGPGRAVLVCALVVAASAVVVVDVGPAGAVAAPTVRSVSPTSGRTAGGTRVRVTGTGFTLVRSVKFGTRAGTSIRVLSSTKLTVIAPAHAAGVVNVRVRTAHGTSAAVAADRYTYVAPPLVTAVSPTSGTTFGGTRVTVIGARFIHVAAVKFGTSSGTSIKVLSPTKLAVTAPAHAAGVVNVRVSTAYGTSAAVAADRYTYAPATVEQVSTGATSACAVTSAGAVMCWGSNAYGELGNGSSPTSKQYSAVPVQVLASGVTQVSVGAWEACARTTAGAVKCWGTNSVGQLGDGHSPSAEPYSSVPVNVVGLSSGASSVSVGQNFACAVVGSGVKCWGYNDAGQLGDGVPFPSQNLSDVPVSVTGLFANATAVTTTLDTACALSVAGAVECWGDNTPYGELGDGGGEQLSTTPVQVTGLTSGITSLSAGLQSGICAVTTGGGLDCWGTIYALVDEVAYGGASSTPSLRFGLSNVARTSLGSENGCVVTTAGAARCWGADPYGNLGNGTTGNGGIGADSATPVAVTGLGSHVRQVASGGYQPYGTGFGCALTDAGALRCWGQDDFGQLGNGGTVDSDTPVGVTGLS